MLRVESMILHIFKFVDFTNLCVDFTSLDTMFMKLLFDEFLTC